VARLAGKVAIVTGGASGIGEAAVRLFAAEGAKVVIADRAKAAGEKLEKALRADGLDVRFFEMDVTEERAWQALIAFTLRAFGKLNILINNAGISIRADVEETDLDIWDRTIAVNQTGVFLGIRHAVLAMKESNEPCSIVNTSSIEGIVAESAFFAYCASKAAVALMTRAAALACGEKRYPIRVNSVHPGYIMSPMAHEDARQAGLTVEEYLRDFIAKHPIGRLGEPIDIAQGMLYLASDESRFVTGTQLVIDGGYTAQ
jgi:NAD(P)-dependent dehydrogenase (short-subunit alcohol dehydrogenase family)